MTKEEYYADILDLKFNQNWLNTEIMAKYKCTYPELKLLFDKYYEKGEV